MWTDAGPREVRRGVEEGPREELASLHEAAGGWGWGGGR